MKQLSRTTHLTVHVHKDEAAMAERAAHIFAAQCEEAIAERNIFNVALSGGQTPVPLFQLLRSPDWVERLPWEKIAIYWVSERCVGPDHPDSNYGQVRRELLSHVPATHYYRMRGENNAEEAALQYEKMLREHFKTPTEVPRFDFILLGMAEDGHTGSIFANSPALMEKKRICVDQYVPERKADRITLTLPILNNPRCCMFLVSGKEKHPALKRSLDLLAPPTLPTQMVRPTFGELIWIVDEAAAVG